MSSFVWLIWPQVHDASNCTARWPVDGSEMPSYLELLVCNCLRKYSFLFVAGSKTCGQNRLQTGDDNIYYVVVLLEFVWIKSTHVSRGNFMSIAKHVVDGTRILLVDTTYSLKRVLDHACDSRLQVIRGQLKNLVIYPVAGSATTYQERKQSVSMMTSTIKELLIISSKTKQPKWYNVVTRRPVPVLTPDWVV